MRGKSEPIKTVNEWLVRMINSSETMSSLLFLNFEIPAANIV